MRILLLGKDSTPLPFLFIFDGWDVYLFGVGVFVGWEEPVVVVLAGVDNYFVAFVHFDLLFQRNTSLFLC